MENRNKAGHLCSLLTIIIWGTTFISTKILLVDFQPVEILFFRFVMGLLALLIIYPHRLKATSMLFHSDKENQQLWISYHSHNKTSILLRYTFYDTYAIYV